MFVTDQWENSVILLPSIMKIKCIEGFSAATRQRGKWLSLFLIDSQRRYNCRIECPAYQVLKCLWRQYDTWLMQDLIFSMVIAPTLNVY